MTDETRKRLLPWLVAVAFFMETLDTTILNTAIPSIAKSLDVVPLSMKAVLASYTLSLAIFIPVSGWVADRFGTRRVFASAIGIFILGSFLCGVSNNIHLLVACRILQGCGGAMMLPVGRITIARSFARSELVRTMSFVAIPGLIGPMIGPLAGGFIVNYFHWSMIFFINIPIGLVGLYFVYRFLPDYKIKESPPLDISGLLQFSSGIALLSYLLEVFGENTLTYGEIIGLLMITAMLLTGYGFHSTRIRRPLLRLKLFRIRTFRIAVLGSYFTRLGIGGVPFLFPLLYQVGLGFTPVQSGLLMIPQAVAAISLKFAIPSLLTRYGYRSVLILNTTMIGLIIMLFTNFTSETPIIEIIIAMFLFGFFTSLQYTSMNTLVFADIVDTETSNASTIASTMQQMSMSFGVAIASLITATFIPNRFESSSIELMHGIHEGFFVIGIMTIISSLIFLQLRDNDGDSVSQHKTIVP